MSFFRTEKEFLAAAAKGDMDVLRHYLEKNPKWLRTAEKKTGDTAIILAARNGQTETVRFLLAKGVRVWEHNKAYATPLHEAVMHGHIETVKALLEKGATSSINGGSYVRTPLQLAIRHDRLDILKLFVETGKANLTADDPPALFFAVQDRKPEAVRLLLDAGANANVPRVENNYDYWGRHEEKKTSPLQLAVLQNATETALMLLQAGAQALPGETPLHAAAHHGNVELATELIRHGVSTKERNEQQQTALHVAASQNKLEMARFLLAQGIGRDIRDKQGNMAIAYAQQFAMKEMIELLQNPLPPPVEIKPVAAAPKPAPAPVVVEEKPKPIPPKPAPVPVAPAPAVSTETETWQLAGKNNLVHTSTFPSLGRKLTEIFNFESRERVVITENTVLKTESMGPHVSFDGLTEEYLRRALQEFRKLGGKAEDKYVFRDSLNKTQLRQP